MKATATIPISAPMSIAALEGSIGKRVPVTWLGSQLGNAIVSAVRSVNGVPYLDLEIDIDNPFHFEKTDFCPVTSTNIGFAPALEDGEDQL